MTIDLSVDSLDVLESACKALGCKLVRGQKTIRWYGRWMKDYHGDDAAYKTMDAKGFGKCDHAIVVPGAKYDIGVVQHRDQPGRWTLYYDGWQGGKGIDAVCGKGLGKLKQRYAAERSKRQMRREGFRVREKVLADGQIQLVCTR